MVSNDPVQIELLNQKYIENVELDVTRMPAIDIHTSEFDIEFRTIIVPTFRSREYIRKSLKYQVTIKSSDTWKATKFAKTADLIRSIFSLITLSPSHISSMRLFDSEDASVRKEGLFADTLFVQSTDLEFLKEGEINLATQYEMFDGQISSVLSKVISKWNSEGYPRLMWVLLEHKCYKQQFSFKEFGELIVELEGYARLKMDNNDEYEDWYKNEIDKGFGAFQERVDNSIHDKAYSLLMIGKNPSFMKCLKFIFSLLPDKSRELLTKGIDDYFDDVSNYRVAYAHAKSVSSKHLVKLNNHYNRTIILIWALLLFDMGFSDDVLCKLISSAIRSRNFSFA